MRNAILTCVVVVLAAAPAASACVNVYGTNLRGEKFQSEVLVGEELVRYLTEPSRVNWRSQKAKLARNLASATFERRNDYAAALLHVGEVAPAIAILTRIEKEKPGLYATATNLGTAYELAGDNVRALQWIREGIRRNPMSHEGSEWLHVLILEAKLNVARDPRWLASHAILAMGFGSAPVPQAPSHYPRGNDGKPLTASELKTQIFAQMRERLQFVKPPDPIVGEILFDYGNLLMRTDALESADAIYALAIKYGAPRTALAKQRRAFIRGMLAR